MSTLRQEFVVGVAIDDVAKAFPLSRLNDKPVVNGQVNDLPLMIVFDQGSATAAVFSRVARRRQSVTRW